MDYLLKITDGISVSSLIVSIAAIVFVISMIVRLYRLVVKTHDEWQEREQKMISMMEELSSFKNDLDDFKADYKELHKMVKNIAIGQDALKEEHARIAEESKQQKKNDLRNKLLQSYRYYTSVEKNPLGAWSEMEKETFEALFKDYDSLGGNGYMHSEVQPAMATLDVISMQDTARFTELMQSRKG